MVAMLALGMNQIIDLIWQHPRPFMIGVGRTWLSHATDSSFPSDHVTVFASVGISLLFSGETVPAAVTLAVSLCVAWSRVLGGVHFSMDMLGALGVAAVTCAVTVPVWAKIGNAITQLAERLYHSVMAQPIARGWVCGDSPG